MVTESFDPPDLIVDGHTVATAPFDQLGALGLAAVIADGDGTVWSVWATPDGRYVATDGDLTMDDDDFSTVVGMVAGIGNDDEPLRNLAEYERQMGAALGEVRP